MNSPSTLRSRRNNGQTTWTYNQGIILSGLSKLYKHTGNASFLHAAETLLDSVLASPLVNSSILVETCDPSRTCDQDQWMFKGVFFGHLAYVFADIVESPELEPRTKRHLIHKYCKFVYANAQAVWDVARGSDGKIGNWWAEPPGEQDLGQFGVEATGSGVAAILCEVVMHRLLRSLLPSSIPSCRPSRHRNR